MLTTSSVRPRGRTTIDPLRRPQLRATVVLLVPFGALFTFGYLLPLAYAVKESFFTTKRSGLGIGGAEVVFAGFDNYVQALQNPQFGAGVGRVLLFGIVQVPIMLGLGLAMALALDAITGRFPAIMRLVAFLPYAVPGVVAAILWAFLYLNGTSPFVPALKALGLPSDFFASGTVLWSIANIITWTWTGYNMLIIYSALKSIPGELFEAAAIDGAGAWRVAWSIKIPLVLPALVLTGFFSIIGTVQLYNEPFILRPFATSVIDPSYTPNMVVQNVAFTLNNYGLGSAMAVILAIGTAALSFGFLGLSSRLTARKSTA